jgi:protein arginine N-methyltransferase 1
VTRKNSPASRPFPLIRGVAKMYGLPGYGGMIADKARLEAYSRAVRQIVKPGSLVLEIGTGPGVFAILACQAGAGRVFAIESSEVIQVAREIAIANHCADRIEFFEDLSTNVKLPVQADAVFSDLRGVLPLFGRHIPSIVDARKRFLKPGGAFSPRKDTLWMAVVEVPKIYAEIVDPWEQSGLDQDLTPARRRVIDSFVRVRATPDQLLTEPEVWATIDYLSIENPDMAGELQWTTKRAGTGHGILVWFDADLAEGAGFSNSPSEIETVYGSMFFPWEHPVELAQGDTICAQMEAKLAGNDYVWRWATQVNPAGLGGRTRDKFDQSTLNGLVISPLPLRKGASDHVARLSDDGVMARRVLELMDGRKTLEQIAQQLAAESPQRFSRWQDAMKIAGAISQKYSV